MVTRSKQLLGGVRDWLVWQYMRVRGYDEPAYAPLVLLDKYIARYVLGWATVWAAQWWLVPHWLVHTRGGLQTLFQVIPAVIVAVLVFVLGALFVVAQQIVNSYSTRAALLMTGDTRFAGLSSDRCLLRSLRC